MLNGCGINEIYGLNMCTAAMTPYFIPSEGEIQEKGR